MATDYQAEGKQGFRDLLLALARQTDIQTYGTFWGTGIDARMFSAAGLDVVAAEIVRAKHLRASCDADMHGYRVHLGRAGRLTERFGMFHADFDGGPSPSNFREVKRLAAITDRWLAVTLSMDHQRDESMMGEAAFYTIPAWLTGASGFTLEYLSRYKRNRFGQTMWVGILQRREGKGTAHQVLPVQIAYSIGERGYWASRRLYERGLLRHRYSPRNQREKASDNARYMARRQRKVAVCRVCFGEFVRLGGPQVYCSDACRLPFQRKQRRYTVRKSYERKLAAVSGTTAEAIKAA